jgi:hypothetical protein
LEVHLRDEGDQRIEKRRKKLTRNLTQRIEIQSRRRSSRLLQKEDAVLHPLNQFAEKATVALSFLLCEKKKICGVTTMPSTEKQIIEEDRQLKVIVRESVTVEGTENTTVTLTLEDGTRIEVEVALLQEIKQPRKDILETGITETALLWVPQVVLVVAHEGAGREKGAEGGVTVVRTGLANGVVKLFDTAFPGLSFVKSLVNDLPLQVK